MTSANNRRSTGTPDDRPQPPNQVGRDDSQALNPLGDRKNNVPPSRMVAAPIVSAERRSLRRVFRTSWPVAVMGGISPSSPAGAAGRGCVNRQMSQASPMPSSPGHSAGPESSASPARAPAMRGRPFHQQAQASRVKARAGIGLPAWRERAIKPGSRARKKVRNRPGVGLRRSRKRKGRVTSRLPVKAGRRRARKFVAPKRKNSAPVGRM